ncbi:tetrapyrrole (Corrin/Porphyrin) Methylases family protein [Mycobacterium ulcerans str. Harvey]|uniref:Tetrapyrrole (Corrin/Porphyrin) Methylases family protein n=1 Tax=Mycobacterium ulcerans str. Harvey TaxID=1299332 RepID=A0ABP3AF33_MYCUL|nr:tetrapyrrole (Corrin/Porphyrin) Methylases family protein [Mycobacterium ulcerans str. Harvey]
MARLHSGDPSLYSALAEQCRRLDALGIGYEIVPGVPAFAAAAAALKREFTVPGVSQTVTLTRISTLSTPMPPGEDLAALAKPGATLVLHLAAAQIDAIIPQLLAGGYRPETPAAVVAFASWPQQAVLRGTLSDIAAQMHNANITKTAVIVVGDVLAADGFTDSYLYSVARRGRIDAAIAARRHQRGARPGRPATSAGRPGQLAGRAGARPRAAGWPGAHRPVRRCRRAATLAR